MAAPLLTAPPIGRDTVRIDGPAKVTGGARYTSDFHFPGMLYAVPVGATIANGSLERLDTTEAEKMPGVRAILHRGNIGRISRSMPLPGFLGICDERRPPFEDDVIRYYGPFVADEDPDAVMTTYGPAKRLQSQRGDPDAAFASAAVKVDHTYITPFETHNPLEPHSTTAIWDGERLTLYE